MLLGYDDKLLMSRPIMVCFRNKTLDPRALYRQHTYRPSHNYYLCYVQLQYVAENKNSSPGTVCPRIWCFMFSNIPIVHIHVVHFWYIDLVIFIPLIQMLQQKQLTSAVYNPASPESMVPAQLNHLSGITNSIGDDNSRTKLRAQVQPFQTYTPQQIQEQLQHLHIQQQHADSESAMHTEVAALLQQPLQKSLTGADGQSLQAGRESSPSKDGTSSILHHLLSQSPKVVPPKAVGIVHSNPFGHKHTQRASFPKNVTAPLAGQSCHQPQDNCPPSELCAMISNVAACSNHEASSFPVNIQTREGSPTKGMGRRSPIHDHQTASIAEDTSEIANQSSGTLATSPISSTPEMPLGLERLHEGYCTVSSVPTGTSLSIHIDESHSQKSGSSGTHGSLRYSNYFVGEHINNVSAPLLYLPP